MSLKAIIFDLDGVLCATDEYHYQSWKKVAAEYRLNFSREINEKLRGLTRRRSLEIILGDIRLPEDVMEEILSRKNHYYLELIEDMNSSDLLPGVNSLLGDLSEAKILVGVASASRNVRQVLNQLGIEGYFHSISDSNTIMHSKPAPDVFLNAAAALKAEPYECIAIEDSRAGVQSARSAGMFVVGVGRPELVIQAHAILPSLADICLKDLKALYHIWDIRGQHPDHPSEVFQHMAGD